MTNFVIFITGNSTATMLLRYFRFTEWQREFSQQVASNSFPNLTLLRLMHDHFGDFGTASFGVNTPELQIADNDYSVGLVADTIARSPYANNTLIFVIEDDPPQTFNRIIWEGMKGTPYPTRSRVLA